MDIVTRMTDYLNRQIDWFEQLAKELGTFGTMLENDQMDELEAMDKKWRVNSQALTDEFWALKKEWDSSTNISDNGRNAVRALALKAENLSADNRKAMENAAAQGGGKKIRIQKDLDELNQGREGITKFHTGDSDKGRRLDQSM